MFIGAAAAAVVAVFDSDATSGLLVAHGLLPYVTYPAHHIVAKFSSLVCCLHILLYVCAKKVSR